MSEENIFLDYHLHLYHLKTIIVIILDKADKIYIILI